MFLVFIVLALVLIDLLYVRNSLSLRTRAHANATNPYAYPEDVTLNFFKWYTSCMEEMEENRQFSQMAVCYQKTSYLTPDLVTAINQKKKTVLCGYDLSFYSVGVVKKSQQQNTSSVAVYDAKSRAFVATASLHKRGDNWVIADLSCKD